MLIRINHCEAMGNVPEWRTELALVILNEVKNQLVGVRVRVTDSATPCSILRRMILRYAQNDRAWWVLSPQHGVLSSRLWAGPRACPLSLPQCGWYTNRAGTRVPS